MTHPPALRGPEGLCSEPTAPEPSPWLGPRWRGTLARNTAWMAVGQGSRVALGASYFVVVARALHPDGLGAFAGAVALVALASPFASLGAGNLMIKHVARDPRHFQRYWGGALSTTIISGVVLGIIIMAVFASRAAGSTIPFQLIVCVVAADLLFSRILDISGQAYQAHERLVAHGAVPASDIRVAADCGGPVPADRRPDARAMGMVVSGQLGSQRDHFGRRHVARAGPSRSA